MIWQQFSNLRHCWEEKKMNKTPAVRFKGFTEDWEQQKLEDISDVRDGTHDSPVYQDEGHPFVTSKNVKNGYINFDGIQYISDYDFFEINKRSKVDINDILMGMIGTIGNLALIRTEPNFAIKNVALIKDTKNVSYLYLYHYLKSSSIERQLLFGMDGGTQKFVSLKKIRELKIQIPDDDEQIKLGTFMESLDNLIVFYQRKYEKLVNIKKSMLYKMFPQNGSKVPEIRFTGFTDDWEQRKLGEICQVTMGQSPDGSTYSETPSDYILVQGNADLKDGWVFPRIWTTQKTKTAEAGDLIMSVRAPAGAMGKTSYNVVLGRGVAGIKGNEFIYQSLVKMDSDGYWKKLAAGSTFESINSDVVNGAELVVPQDIAEQNKIGEYFSSIDHLITLNQRKLEKLKQLKQAMLHKMFV